MAKRGVDIVLYANTGSDGSPVWTIVGAQRNATLNEENDMIDVSAKDSAGTQREYEYGMGGWTVSCDGVWVPSDTAYASLQTALRNKTKIKVRIKDGAAYFVEGQALVQSRSLEAPYDGEATYSMELQGTGQLTANPV